MSWQEAVLEVAEEMAGWAEQERDAFVRSWARQLCRIVKAAKGASAPPQPVADDKMAEQQRRYEEALQRDRRERQARQRLLDEQQTGSLRLCVGGSLDGTYVPSEGVERDKPVKSPASGELYVLKEDGLMHFCKETP